MPEREIAVNVDQMLEEIQERLNYNLNMIKQIQGTYRGIMDSDEEAQAAEAEIYPLWREYLRAYRDHVGHIEGHEKEVRQTYEDFGTLEGDFQDWWRNAGRELFIERGPLAVIDVEGIDRNWDGAQGEYPTHITLKIPLTVPRDNILKQFNDVMDKCHMGTLLYRHKHSTANYALYGRSKYIRENFEKMLRVWVLERLHREGKPKAEQMPWWEIGHLANLSPAMDPYNDTAVADAEEAQRHLAKLASDLFKKAEKIMHNAVRGEFPKPTIG
jgi:hypothetical protein